MRVPHGLVVDTNDRKDDKFLEVALNRRADVIITADADSLALRRLRKVAISSPADDQKR